MVLSIFLLGGSSFFFCFLKFIFIYLFLAHGLFSADPELSPVAVIGDHSLAVGASPVAEHGLRNAEAR